MMTYLHSKFVNLGTFASLWVLFLYASATLAQSQSDPTDIIPDLRNDEMRLKLQKGDFVVVPIGQTANWLIRGNFVQTQLSRKVSGEMKSCSYCNGHCAWG